MRCLDCFPEEQSLVFTRNNLFVAFRKKARLVNENNITLVIPFIPLALFFNDSSRPLEALKSVLLKSFAIR